MPAAECPLRNARCGVPAAECPLRNARCGVAAEEWPLRSCSDLIEGPPLVPREYLSDGLHPDERGMRELALNLNAQLGFTRVHFEVVKCPPLTLAVSGLEPGSWFDVYWGAQTGNSHLVGADGSVLHGCRGRSLMITPYGKAAATADSSGRATVEIPQIGRRAPLSRPPPVCISMHRSQKPDTCAIRANETQKNTQVEKT